jgi:transglutaminase-like putative cysteine protease
LDSVPGLLPDTGKIRMTVDVKVEYLPPNTTSLLQPMEQGIIVNFKAYYLQQTGRGKYYLGGGRGILEKGTFGRAPSPQYFRMFNHVISPSVALFWKIAVT